jgi:hypothetical protein
MTKAFTKGEAVTFLGDWDRKGSAFFRHAVVYSCGAKQMVLTDAVTGEEIGRHFKPVKAEGAEEGTRARMTDEEAAALTLVIGAAVVASETAHFNNCLARHPDNAGYCASIRKSLSELHEPRTINRTGSTFSV